MSIRNQGPQTPGEPALQFGDTGNAVKKVQDFLQSLSSTQDYQSLLFDSFSLQDQNHYGKFEKDTRLILADWQKKIAKDKIKKIGNLNEEQFQKEVGQVGYATWLVISGQENIKNALPKPPPLQPEISPLKYPPQSKTVSIGTHYVKTKDSNSRLALREAPAFVSVSKNAWEDNDKKGKLRIMMNNNVLLKVIEPFVGYQCEWHQVEVVDKDNLFDEIKKEQKKRKFYAYAEFVQPLSETAELLSVRCCTEKNVKFENTFSEWTELDDCEPFIDVCYYCSVVTLDEERTSQSLLPQQKKKALRQGVKQLLNFYDKPSDDALVDRLLNSYQFAFIPDDGWNLSDRPNSKLKFLVKVYKKYFDAIARKTEDLNDLSIIGGKLPKEWRTTVFNTSTLEERVEIVAKRFEEYYEIIKRKPGETLPIEPTEEADRIRAFPGVLEEFVVLNGFDYRKKEEDTIELGFEGPCFNLVYVLLNQGKGSAALRIGFDCFKRKEPIKFQRTMGYIFYLDEMVREIKKTKRPWIQFVQEYSCPIPEIKPSQNLPKKEKLIFEEKTVKTTKEKQIEEKIINDFDFKKELLKERRIRIDFIGDNVLSCENIPAMLNRIHSLESVYDEVLNKINISSVAGFVASCLSINMNPIDINISACKALFNKLTLEQLNKVVSMASIPQQELIGEIISNELSSLAIGEESDLRKIKKDAISKSITEEELCKLLNEFDPEFIFDFIQSLTIDIRKITPPTIELPDDLPIEDILESIGREIEKAVRQALSEALIAVVKEIFKKICELCTNNSIGLDEIYGDENLNDIPFFNGDRNLTSEDLTNDFFGDELNLEDFFNDLSLLLLPSEICKLLNGTAGEKILKIVEGLIDSKYKQLKKFFFDTNEIKKFFIYMGKFVDSSICEKIMSKENKPVNGLCNSDVMENSRKSFLTNKMSPEQAEQQLNELRKKQREQLSQLANIAEDELLSNFPSIQNDCLKSKGGNAMTTQPSVDFLNKKVIDTMFSGVESSFDSDISEYTNSLIEFYKEKAELDFASSNEEFKQAYDIRRKSINDITEKDTEVLLNNPDEAGASRNRKLTAVAPELTQLLVDSNNFEVKDENLENETCKFVYKATLIDILKKIEKLRKSLFQSQPELELQFTKLLNAAVNEPGGFDSIASNLGNLLEQGEEKIITEEMVAEREAEIKAWEENQKNWKFLNGTEFLSDKKPEPLCATEFKKDEKILELQEFAKKNFIDNQTLIEYSFFPYTENSKKDSSFIKVFDTNYQEPILLLNENDVGEKIKNIIGKYKIYKAKNKSAQQEVFAEFIKQKWMSIVNFNTKKNLDKDTIFYNFFRDNTFNKIVETMMFEFARNTVYSKLFRTNNLEQLELAQDSNENQLCPIDEEKEFFNIRKIKEDVKFNYDKNLVICAQGFNENDSSVDFEKSGIGGVIVSTLRLYVIEEVLKSLFVSSEYDIKDILENEIVYQYIVEKVKRELKSYDSDYYENFAREARDFVFKNGDKLIDPITGEEFGLESKENKVLSNPVHPDAQSGEAAVEYLIKKQLKPVFEVLRNVLANFNGEKVEKKFIKKMISQSGGALLDAVSINNFLSQYEKNEGAFFLDKYVRVCRDNSLNGVVENIGFEQNNFSHGLRLVYISPLNAKGEKNKNPFDGISFIDNKIIDDEKTYKIKGNLNENIPDIFVTPLIVVEEEKARTEHVLEKEKDKIYEELIEKMINTNEWKVLFEYCFPLKNFLALNAIYTMTAISISVDNIDTAFERTKQSLRSLFHTLFSSIDGETWWNKGVEGVDDKGGNVGIRKERMSNITTKGSAPSLLRMALNTIPIMVKGMAERYDPAYQLIKKLDDAGAAIGGLSWGSVPQIMPINFFPLIGFGPPLGTWGVLALSLSLLPGEKKAKKERENEFKIDKKEDKCEEGEEE